MRIIVTDLMYCAQHYVLGMGLVGCWLFNWKATIVNTSMSCGSSDILRLQNDGFLTICIILLFSVLIWVFFVFALTLWTFHTLFFQLRFSIQHARRHHSQNTIEIGLFSQNLTFNSNESLFAQATEKRPNEKQNLHVFTFENDVINIMFLSRPNHSH